VAKLGESYPGDLDRNFAVPYCEFNIGAHVEQCYHRHRYRHPGCLGNRRQDDGPKLIRREHIFMNNNLCSLLLFILQPVLALNHRFFKIYPSIF
jgi:hypothetical protein